MDAIFRTAPKQAPEAPRDLTPDMVSDASARGAFLRLFGAIWLGVGGALVLAFGAMALSGSPAVLVGAGLGAAFALAGAALWAIGRVQHATALALFRDGVEAQGHVTRVTRDTNVRMNGRHPWRVDYEFMVDGDLVKGSVSSWKPEMPTLRAADPVTVLYAPGKPHLSLLWTPLTARETPPPRRVVRARARLRTTKAEAESKSDASDAATDEAAEAEARAEADAGTLRPRRPGAHDTVTDARARVTVTSRPADRSRAR